MSEAASQAHASGDSQSEAGVKGPRILVAASGSGGHLVPALHIMRALKELSPAGVVEMIGAGKPLEETIIVGNGFKRHILKAAAIKQRGIFGPIRFILSLPAGIAGCIRLFKSYKPDVVVGVGGYVSVLPVFVARCMRIPTWIHEAELHLGVANRALVHCADSISVSFPETQTKGRAKRTLTGHPVRQELRQVATQNARADAPKNLLVLGGSQGARGLDTVVPTIAPLLKERGVEVVHQCRPENMELVVSSYKTAGVKASVVSFIDDMPGAYQWSDIIISRAGASSVAEIACVNRPVIFVPYPFQQGTHQTDNAHSLASVGKAYVVEERDPDFAEKLLERVTFLLDRKHFEEMRSRPLEPRGLDAAKNIAAGILSLIRPRG